MNRYRILTAHFMELIELESELVVAARKGKTQAALSLPQLYGHILEKMEEARRLKGIKDVRPLTQVHNEILKKMAQRARLKPE